MTGHYAYPADEFDTAPPDGRPRGVHRAPRSWWSRWGAFVTVLVVFPVLAFGAVTWLSSWDGSADVLPALAGAGGGDDPAPPAPQETATAPGTPAPADPPVEPEAPVEPTPTPEPPPAPEPDLGIAVQVLNATNRSGLAGGASEVLASAGFTATSTGNWRGDELRTSVVLYREAADEVTARAAADALGLTSVVQDDDVVEGLVVVLTDDYRS